jgi:hypothetical protein
MRSTQEATAASLTTSPQASRTAEKASSRSMDITGPPTMGPAGRPPAYRGLTQWSIPMEQM